MKKGLILLTLSVLIFGCSCSLQPKDGSGGSSGLDKIVSVVKHDYPDQLVFGEGGTDSMTVFRCGACYYACIDGTKAWSKLYSINLDLEEGEFVHIDADYTKAYGGVEGFMGNMKIDDIRNLKSVTLDDVVEMGQLASYDKNAGSFSGLQLIVKDGKNYLFCRGPLLTYIIFDDAGNTLCTCDTAMEAAAYLDDDADQDITYSSSTNVPFRVIRLGDTYYAYSRYDGLNTWTPLLNLEFENEPVGFELEDGQVMRIDSTTVYKVNGGKDNYVNAPMFERTDNMRQIGYMELCADLSAEQWERISTPQTGCIYIYSDGMDYYLIFCLADGFHVYYEYNSDLATEEFVGLYKSADEVNKAVGRE